MWKLGEFVEKEIFLKRMVVGPLQVNCYILGCPDKGEAAIIDPGDDAGEIASAVRESGLKPLYILNTHGHPDHVGANEALKGEFGLKIVSSPLDAALMQSGSDLLSLMGVRTVPSPPPDVTVGDGDTIDIGDIRLEVLHTPGHTEGGICLYWREGGLLFTGDTLFAGSIGRTDFPGGSWPVLEKSIRERIYSLPGETVILPGHGESSTVAREKASNAFVRM